MLSLHSAQVAIMHAISEIIDNFKSYSLLATSDPFLNACMHFIGLKIKCP